MAPSGLLAGDVRGKLFIEMSTVQPRTEVALAEKVRAKGAALVECPVGGSTGPARQGKLIGLMGAEPGDAERAGRFSSNSAGDWSIAVRSDRARS